MRQCSAMIASPESVAPEGWRKMGSQERMSNESANFNYAQDILYLDPSQDAEESLTHSPPVKSNLTICDGMSTY